MKKNEDSNPYFHFKIYYYIIGKTYSNDECDSTDIYINFDPDYQYKIFDFAMKYFLLKYSEVNFFKLDYNKSYHLFKIELIKD